MIFFILDGYPEKKKKKKKKWSFRPTEDLREKSHFN